MSGQPFFFFVRVMRCSKWAHAAMNIRKTHLSHITFKLILIRVGMNHKDGKAITHNITAFPRPLVKL